jgi:hypothetical protein
MAKEKEMSEIKDDYHNPIVGTGFYETRRGDLVFIFKRKTGVSQPWVGFYINRDLGITSWNTNGTYNINGSFSMHDITETLKLISIEKICQKHGIKI